MTMDWSNRCLQQEGPRPPHTQAQLVGSEEAQHAFNLEGILATRLVLLVGGFSSSSSDDLFWG